MDTTITQVETDFEPGNWVDEFEAYLDLRVEDEVGSEKTTRAYLSDVRIYADWFEQTNGEAFEPGFLTNTDLRAFRKWSMAQGVKPATWNRRRAALRVLWRWALANEIITHNVDIFDGVRTLGLGKSAPKWLAEKDYNKLKRILENTRNHATSEWGGRQGRRDFALFALMAWAGLREAEVCALCLGDIELGERSGAVEVRCGKGGKPRRVVLNSEARAAVRSWLEVRGEREDDWMFYGVRGEALGVQAVQHVVAGAAQACGIGHVTPHQLRHTFCHRVLSANYERLGDKALLTVAQMAGHARLDTTRRYVVLSDEELLSVLEEM